MSIFVCSDIHGEFEKLMKILQDINFNSNDKLIINGDIIDRGCKSAELMEFVLDNENVELLLGNHELLFMKAYDVFPELYKGRAYSSNAKRFEETYLHYINGGRATMDSLRRYYKINDRDLAQEFYVYLKNAKLSKVIDGVTISHTGNSNIDNIEDSVWDRSRWIFAMAGARDVVGTNVIGHTSVGVRYLIIEDGDNQEFSFIVESTNGGFLINLDGSDRGILPLYDIDNHIIFFKKNYRSDGFFKIDISKKKVVFLDSEGGK